MSTVETIIQDPARITAVHRLGVLDSALHEPLDTLARLAARSVAAPVSSISLVDGERQYFIAVSGLGDGGGGRRHIPVERSVCRFTVAAGTPIQIADLRADERFPEAIRIDGREVVAYLGVPLRLAGGAVVGTLCVVDGQPRDWSTADSTVLADLAGSVVGFLTLRCRVLDRVLHDPVAGIPGETLFLARCTALRRRPSPGRSAIYRIDLPAGSAPRRSAESLTAAVDPTAVVGRMSDGAFAVFAHGLRDERDALALAGQLRRTLAEGDPGTGAARIGIALGDVAEETAAELMHRAEHVMRGVTSDGACIRLASRAA